MVCLFVYGSLLSLDELEKQSFENKNFVKVKLKNYRRIFNQKPSWRKAEGKNISVLNIEKSESDFVNGICIFLSEDEFKEFEYRERGYNKQTIDIDEVEFYNKNDSIDSLKIITFIGKKEKRDSTILPNDEYLDICIKAAKTQGKDFYKEFLSSTFTNTNETINKYIENRK